MIDVGWPHQVALPADACTGKQYVVQHEFCRGLSLFAHAVTRFAGTIATMLCSALRSRPTLNVS